jgi:hypothetical protein
MKSVYDFLSPEDRRWLLRCRLVAAVLLVGLVATIALDTAQGDGAMEGRWYASHPATAVCCK